MKYMSESYEVFKIISQGIKESLRRLFPADLTYNSTSC